MTQAIDLLERPRRDLGADELWRRSLARSRERRELGATGGRVPRSLISATIPDLDAPAEYRRLSLAAGDRDLSDDDLWDLSLACARAKRRAARKGTLPQARVASASLVVAAIAAVAPSQGGAHSRASSERAAHADVELLKLGSRGSAVRAVQQALGIPADGIFGPQTRAAVRAFQAKHGLLVDGIVGPQTRAVLFGRGEDDFIRAWWVAPVQRALGVAVDGVYGPQTRAAVRAYQGRHGLVVDGIVGPQTLASLGIARGRSSSSHGERETAAASTRGARAAAIAKRYLGIRYRWGGASPRTGFDCSGFVMYVYAKVGVSLPHNAAAQYHYGRRVSRSALRAGDVVFFDRLGHDGIYLGGGRFIHAPHSGDVVKISSLHESWYARSFVGARRL
ncbi:MAG: peptidoglycan-binding protein [Actinomycetota bacterium]|nr:peptidoglycan-binding protein [Actinomycetota bacterium]